MKRVSLFFVGLLAFLVPALMAPTSGGFPSRPTFQAVTVNGTATLQKAQVGSASANAGSTATSIVGSSTAGNSFGVLVTAGTNASDYALRVTSQSGATEFFKLAGSGAIIANSVDITPSVGTFTASFDDACTTTPTVTFTYVKIGTVVTLTPTSTSGFPCTGDSLAFATTGTPVPSVLRPATATVTSPTLHDGINNGTQTSFTISVSTGGNVSLSTVSSAGQSGTYTAAGSRTFGMLNVAFSYLTNN